MTIFQNVERDLFGGKRPGVVLVWLAPFLAFARVTVFCTLGAVGGLSCTLGAVGGVDLRGWRGLGGLGVSVWGGIVAVGCFGVFVGWSSLWTSFPSLFLFSPGILFSGPHENF